jgi:hypothetical protein
MSVLLKLLLPRVVKGLAVNLSPHWRGRTKYLYDPQFWKLLLTVSDVIYEENCRMDFEEGEKNAQQRGSYYIW